MAAFVFFVVAVFMLSFFRDVGAERAGPGAPFPCSNAIFCTGPLLEMVQFSELFDDQKEFVDMPLVANSSVVLAAFFSENITTRDQLSAFVNTWFEPAGSDLLAWIPPDVYRAQTSVVLNPQQVYDGHLRDWAQSLILLWKVLGRATSDDVKTNPDRHSLLALENGFVVPGGRFRESYYWDAYWGMKGLLVCNMNDTVKGMLENYLSLVAEFGFVPNGGRVYYSLRSQPPMLTSMVEDYFSATNDMNFLQSSIDLLVQEYNFWMTNRSVLLSAGKTNYTFNYYHVVMGSPRPESYLEDFLTMNSSHRDPLDVYSELASAAESGWDFSSRWLGSNMSLTTIRTSSVIPVDLNAILYKTELTLSAFFTQLGNSPMAVQYAALASRRKAGMNALFWSSDCACFRDLDYNATSHSVSQRTATYASAFVPLWAGLTNDYTTSQADTYVNYMDSLKFFSYNGGVPTSLLNSGQQWDFPNSWPPLVWFAVMGLDSLPTSRAKQMAASLAQDYITAAYLGFKKTGYMFEKYDVEEVGSEGGGGEYVPQSGFLWTNGVAFSFLSKYGKSLTAPDTKTNSKVPLYAAIVGGICGGLIVIVIIVFVLRARQEKNSTYQAIND